MSELSNHTENIIKFRSAYITDDKKKIQIVFDYLEGGNMREFIVLKPKVLSEHDLRTIMIQLVLTTDFMH